MSNDKSLALMRAEKQASHIKVMAILDAYAAQVQEVIDAMPADSVVRVDADYDSIHISTSGDKHALSTIVRAMRVRGFSSPKAPPNQNDTGWYAIFEHQSGARIFLDFTSTACRRVKVGTKMVEQDVYETVCNETVLPESRTEWEAA